VHPRESERLLLATTPGERYGEPPEPGRLRRWELRGPPASPARFRALPRTRPACGKWFLLPGLCSVHSGLMEHDVTADASEHPCKSFEGLYAGLLFDPTWADQDSRRVGNDTSPCTRLPPPSNVVYPHGTVEPLWHLSSRVRQSRRLARPQTRRRQWTLQRADLSLWERGQRPPRLS